MIKSAGLIFILMGLFLLIPLSVWAMSAENALPDPAQEERAEKVGSELRCVVCQSESINDSQAEMAHDMRILIREKIKGGWTDDQILGYLRDRYGDFILLRPPFQTNTYVLWLLPFGFLMLAAGLLCLLFRRRARGG